MDRDEQRRSYILKYKRNYKKLGIDTGARAKELIERLADMAVTLDECEEHIKAEGSVTEMQQGNYTIMRENPYCGVKDKTLKSYLSVHKAICDLAPDAKTAAAAKAGDALKSFLEAGKPKA